METTTSLADALKSTYLLRGLTQEQVDRVVAVAQMKEFSGGDTILRQFSKDSDVMLVLEGDVRINSFSGEKIAEAGAGSIIGEMALVDDKPRSATVVSVGRCRVAMIPSKGLWDIMKSDAEAARIILLNICQVLSAKLRAANIQLDFGVRG